MYGKATTFIDRQQRAKTETSLSMHFVILPLNQQ